MAGGGRNQRLGAWGESQACYFLVRRGFTIVERNYHTTTGEIDVVARQGDDWYFIEVKTRFGSSLATDLAITRQKRRRFLKAVSQFCYRRDVVPSGSLMLAGLLVRVERQRGALHFRLVVFTD